MAIFCPEYKKMIKKYETTVSKIIYYDKKNEFLEDIREISLVGSLNAITQLYLFERSVLLSRHYHIPATRLSLYSSYLICSNLPKLRLHTLHIKQKYGNK